MRSRAIGLVTLVAVAWAGMAGAQCEGGRCTGDNNGDGEVDVAELVRAVSVALSGCTEATCQAPLPSGECRLPASGQTTSYGAGTDGDVRAGAALSFTDNGDGTVTDNNTGLMWEKKDDSGGIHDMDNTYNWTREYGTMNGSIVTTFLALLNRRPCLAGHCDWRIPNIRELQSLVDYEIPYPGPMVSAAFSTTAVGCQGCTNATLKSCSCTMPYYYASSTTARGLPLNHWIVDFRNGHALGYGDKASNYAVRAVRGGL